MLGKSQIVANDCQLYFNAEFFFQKANSHWTCLLFTVETEKMYQTIVSKVLCQVEEAFS